MPAIKGIIMTDDMILLAQTFVNVLAWFLVPFATIVAITWVVSLFGSRRR